MDISQNKDILNEEFRRSTILSFFGTKYNKAIKSDL